MRPAEEVFVFGRDVAMSSQPKHWLRKPRQARLVSEVMSGITNELPVSTIYTARHNAVAAETSSITEIVPHGTEYSLFRVRM